MTRRRFRFHRISLPLALAAFFAAAPASPSGFQVMTQGAKATGMGLAFTAVADDPSAIFYNPAGLGWQKHFEAQIGAEFISKVKGDFEGANPYPGVGVAEKQHKTTFVVPNLYAVIPLTPEINFGLGINAPYGLGYRWDDRNGPNTFSGRFVAQNAVIQTVDLNPVLSFQATPSFAVAVGADYRLSKVQLERNQAAINPFTNSEADVAHIKLNSKLQDNHGWGWNAGVMFRPVPQFSFGAAYRSKIKVDYDGRATFTQISTGNPAFDAAVAAGLPSAGDHPVKTSIEFPATLNLGAAFTFPGDFLVALEADWTRWRSFNELLIRFPDIVGRDLDRQTMWKNSWAYRIGLEKKFGRLAFRAGYYRDKTPQPREDVGPILADNDRDAFSLGLGFGTDRWGIDISDLYLKVKDINTRGRVINDNFFGAYKEAVNILAFSLRLAF
ncbi:MAG TPA: outer membrane protein transport protein [Thermoanaerobaculia bacterium]|nr:outer membrane protein transport protein [Thermoanaerobaculia bacterium]